MKAQSEAPGVKDWLLELLIDYSGMDFCEANDCMSWQSCKEFMGHVEAKINRLITEARIDELNILRHDGVCEVMCGWSEKCDKKPDCVPIWKRIQALSNNLSKEDSKQ